MTESPNQFKQTFPTEPPPYPGHIRFQKRKNGLYASHVKNTYKRNRKVYHDYDYLGKVIDQENLLFYHTKKGFFNFSLEKGYIPRPDLSLKIYSSERESLRYGDIWVFDDIITKSGLLSVFKIVTPGDTDTLLTLVAYKLSNPGQPFDNIAHWYDRSFAQIKYPNAIVSSSDISKYLHKLGQDLNHQDFTVHYLNIMSQYNQFNGLKEFPVLIDSSVLPTKIDIPLTAVSNHNGLINNKVRLIYVFDQKSGLPIFFNAIPRFIIDNSTLKHTINTLQANEIDIKFIIMDAGYSSEQNLIFLNKLHIPYITRMNANKTIFRDIVLNHGSDIDKAQYAVEYNGRFLHCKKIPYVIKDYQYYAYLIKDIDQLS
ncbi:MAG: transposase, partial [Deltaproteobacteria bacterium]|nr:transposase [Deltaproteobacteria bacterium]